MPALYYPTDEYVQSIVKRHFDPDHGTAYWLARQQALNTDALEQVRSLADLKRVVGFRGKDDQEAFEHATRYQPLENFIPGSLLTERRWFWASQTGGTTGAPKNGCWDNHYWKQVLNFSNEFLDAYGVPRGVNWLFVGPTGPHTTGRLIISLAEHRGGRCFSIDLDPRIVKIFDTEGMADASKRYIRHIWDQITPLIRHQKIDVLFCTSRLLEMMPEYLSGDDLRGIKAVVHAGTTMWPDTHRFLKEVILPGVPIIGVYGTSTTGISFQAPPETLDDYRVIYIPSSPHIWLEVVRNDGTLADYGEQGDVATYRLTDDYLIPGFIERDRATRIEPYGMFKDKYPWDWIGDPYSPEFTVLGKAEGVY